jgi:hypothetical protein
MRLLAPQLLSDDANDHAWQHPAYQHDRAGDRAATLLVSSGANRYPTGMGEYIEQRNIDRSRAAGKRPAKRTPGLIGRNRHRSSTDTAD